LLDSDKLTFLELALKLFVLHLEKFVVVEAGLLAFAKSLVVLELLLKVLYALLVLFLLD
jgi:hypothetical protein